MANINNIPVITNPQLIDKVIAEIQKGLTDNISWLNYAFGRAQRLVKEINGKKIFTPNIYAGGNEYIEVSPDASIGNFSFFVIDDPQIVNWQPNIQGEITVNYSLIVWLNIDQITGAENRNTELIKSEILRVLNGRFRYKFGKLNVTKIYEQSENIYRGFTLDEIDNQYLMHPYCGFRFSGELTVSESCYN